MLNLQLTRNNKSCIKISLSSVSAQKRIPASRTFCLHWRLQKAYEKSGLELKEFKQRLDTLQTLLPGLCVADYNIEPWMLNQLILDQNQIINRITQLKLWIPGINFMEIIQNDNLKCLILLLMPQEKFDKIPFLLDDIRQYLEQIDVLIYLDRGNLKKRVELIKQIKQSENIIYAVENQAGLLYIDERNLIDVLENCESSQGDKFYGRPPLPSK
eukprot:TRINITY_DN1105_c0_g2_i1.p1 TRINITY_DN1105_c0_g2~~TRINITY_DN1105_c0_g2_i1.p1  ORF type:complete len:214 (-),score=16.18 TRINITY_DN1105_c0_g2_i1:76-717(-)